MMSRGITGTALLILVASMNAMAYVGTGDLS